MNHYSWEYLCKQFGNVKFPYRKALCKELFFFFLVTVAMPLLLYLTVGFEHLFPVIACALLMLFICIFISLPVLWEYLDYRKFIVCSDIIVFHDVKYNYRIPNQDPINNVYSEVNDNVFRISLKGIVERTHKKISIRCILTETKNQLLKDLLFPKDSTSSKKHIHRSKANYNDYFDGFVDYTRILPSYPLKVFYTRYNHYLLYFELMENIQYPDDFKLKIKELNSSF